MDRPSPSAGSAPTVSAAERDLAKRLRILSRYYGSLADALDRGEGKTKLQTIEGRSMRHDLHERAAEIVAGFNALPITRAMDELCAAERVIQLKANLQALYRFSRETFNSLKRRDGERSAARTVSKAFARMLRSAFPFPLTPAIEKAARDNLAPVLSKAMSPLDAVVAPTQAALTKYRQYPVTPDLVRQGAGLKAGGRKQRRADEGTLHAIADEQQRLLIDKVRKKRSVD
jgi:hypothetical protein